MKAFGVIAIWFGLTLGAGCIDPGTRHSPDTGEAAQAVALDCEVAGDDPACATVDAGVADPGPGDAGPGDPGPGDGLDELGAECPIEIVLEDESAAGNAQGAGCTHEQWRACNRPDDLLVRAACQLACLASEGVEQACKGTPSRYACRGWPKVWKAACKALGY